MNDLKREKILRFSRIFFICLLTWAVAVSGGIQAASGKSPSKREIASILDNLSDDNFEVRKEALNKISEIGAPAVPALMEQLVGGERRTSTAAAIALGVIRDRRAVEPLALMLNSDSPNVRYFASWALGKIGDVTFTENLKGLIFNDSSSSVRYGAFLAVYDIDNKEVINPLLVSAYVHSDEKLTAQAMKSLPWMLRKYPDEADIWVLIDFVRKYTDNPKPITANDRANAGSNTPSVEKLLATEKAVVAALKILRDREIKAVSETLIYNSSVWDLMGKLAWDQAQGAGVQIAALSFNTVMGGGISGRNKLVSIILDSKENMGVRKKAITAIAEAKKPVGLIDVFDKLDDDELRVSVVNSLAGFPRDWIVDRLVGLLTAETCSYIRLCHAAVGSLGQIGDPRAVPVLLDIVESYKPISSRPKNETDWKSPLNLDSLQALGKIGDPCAVPALLRTVRSDSAYIRSSAGSAILGMKLQPIIGSLIEKSANEKPVLEDESSKNCSMAGMDIILDLYRVAMDDTHPARDTARLALARAGAFQVLPPPPVPVEARESYAQAQRDVENENYKDVNLNYSAAVNAAPWWPAARYNLAVSQEVLGRRASALYNFKIYLVQNPNGENLAEVEARIEELGRPLPPQNLPSQPFRFAKDMIEVLPSREVEEPMIVPRLQFVARDRKKG